MNYKLLAVAGIILLSGLGIGYGLNSRDLPRYEQDRTYGRNFEIARDRKDFGSYCPYHNDYNGNERQQRQWNGMGEMHQRMRGWQS